MLSNTGGPHSPDEAQVGTGARINGTLIALTSRTDRKDKAEPDEKPRQDSRIPPGARSGRVTRKSLRDEDLEKPTPPPL
ncbi:MAG TPA: hypothetical protein DCX60_07630 [Phycisphaerales bacterium]|nr:hypothetical protein [Phycisphaerales bacterium]